MSESEFLFLKKKSKSQREKEKKVLFYREMWSQKVEPTEYSLVGRLERNVMNVCVSIHPGSKAKL
jgi:hypothetical protein